MSNDKTTLWCSESTKELLDKPDGVTWDYWLRDLHRRATNE